MNIIQNQNVAFRCPNTLKEKLKIYADENDLRVSAVIRNACVAWLRHQNPVSPNALPGIPSSSGWLAHSKRV